MDQNYNPEDDENDGIEAPAKPSEESTTALIPLSFFPGGTVEPGKTCKIKVDKVLEGQAQVTYVQHEVESSVEQEPQSPKADEEMIGMMNE